MSTDVAKLLSQFEKKKKIIISLEVVPPLKGSNIEELFKVIEDLITFNPCFINITTHSSKYVILKKPFLVKKIKKRPGSIGIATAIQNKYNLITIPHILCRGFSKHSTENTLIELNYLGVNNLLLLRGDNTNLFNYEKPNLKDHNSTTLDLIKQVNKINKGKLLEKNLKGFKTNFSYGIGGYPEKHPDASTMTQDILYTKKKIKLGAKYIITQFFFDNNYFFNYYNKCRKMRIKVPIIPGIKLISSKKQITTLSKIFHITIPTELQEKILDASTKEKVKQIGVNWCIKQCLSLIEFKVPCIHFYTMSRTGQLIKVLTQLKKMGKLSLKSK